MKVFSKICLLIFPLSLIIGLNIFYNLHQTTNSILFEENASYFVGSSRVQRGLNPEQINQNEDRIYNVGISGSTFFNNVMLAEHLINNAKPKELFIELSPIIYTFSEAQNSMGVRPSSAFRYLLIYNSIHLKETIDIAEMILFYNLSVKENIKRVLISKKIVSSQNSIYHIGYVNGEDNNYFHNDSFLQLKNLETKYNVDISEYSYFISNLTQLADKHNVKIRFFLPLTFKRQAEREIVSTVYQSLPSGMKVKYSKAFIDKISHSENLVDKNHFNNKGAEIMTDYFGKLYFF